MKHIELEYLKPFIRSILERSMSAEYAERIVETEGFVERIRDDIETTSAWETEGHYNLDDVFYAIGRIFWEDLNERSLTI